MVFENITDSAVLEIARRCGLLHGSLFSKASSSLLETTETVFIEARNP